jgi:4-hydroxy-tetrahydrodipicolinate synthase
MFQGSMVALVTPMLPGGELDWEGLHKLVEWHLEKGTHALVAVGTTGESATLNVREHLQVIKAIVDQVNGRVPVIAGTGANSTWEAIELTQSAKDAGADACLSVTPYYNKPTQEGLFLHHQAIARAVPLPQILYNVPGRTGVDMLPQTIARLAEVEHIIGVKEATGDMERVKWLRANVRDDFMIVSGDDHTAVELILLGGKGSISVTANVAPAEASQMCLLALAGKADEARAINQRLVPVHEAMFVESNPIPVKWAVAELGLTAHGVRLPLTPLSEIYHQRVRDALKGAGLL